MGGRPRKELGISDAELARRYQDGQSIRQLAASLGGIYYNVVRNRLLAHGVQLRPVGGRALNENHGESARTIPDLVPDGER